MHAMARHETLTFTQATPNTSLPWTGRHRMDGGFTHPQKRQAHNISHTHYLCIQHQQSHRPHQTQACTGQTGTIRTGFHPPQKRLSRKHTHTHACLGQAKDVDVCTGHIKHKIALGRHMGSPPQEKTATQRHQSHEKAAHHRSFSQVTMQVGDCLSPGSATRPIECN